MKNKQMKRYFIPVFLFSLFIILFPGCRNKGNVTKDPDRPLIGVIRWDGWVGSKGTWKIGPIVERTLGPERFHYRLPFYARVIGKDSVSIDGTNQETVDKEIEFARDAGIDYWAYCYYPDGCGLEIPLKLHQSSRFANDMNWCVILGGSFEFDTANDYSRRLVNDFARVNYQKVCGGRPIIYLLHGCAMTRDNLDTLKAMTLRSGLKTPYVVVMEWSAEKGAEYCDRIGADALSCYAFMGKDNLPFSEFIPDSSIRKWEEYSLKKPVVPWISTGWNARPRMESPNPWTRYYADSTNCLDASPEDIRNFLVSGISWVKSNRDKVPANTVLMYAWNEFDEGFGAICPTLGKDGKPDTLRLSAVKDAIIQSR
jgi:hypothetical protein